MRRVASDRVPSSVLPLSGASIGAAFGQCKAVAGERWADQDEPTRVSVWRWRGSSSEGVTVFASREPSR